MVFFTRWELIMQACTLVAWSRACAHIQHAFCKVAAQRLVPYSKQGVSSLKIMQALVCNGGGACRANIAMTNRNLMISALTLHMAVHSHSQYLNLTRGSLVNSSCTICTISGARTVASTCRDMYLPPRRMVACEAVQQRPRQLTHQDWRALLLQ